MSNRTTFDRLRLLNSAESDEVIQRMINGFTDGTNDGYIMLKERFNISSDVACKLANDITAEGMDVYERLETMMNDMGLPPAGSGVMNYGVRRRFMEWHADNPQFIADAHALIRQDIDRLIAPNLRLGVVDHIEYPPVEMEDDPEFLALKVLYQRAIVTLKES